ncbi:hypothetical protein O974_22850 [Mycobacterium avium 11-0986]|nr:hypothetical protein O974_22850 [Mycobacterium avium 11-0986]
MSAASRPTHGSSCQSPNGSSYPSHSPGRSSSSSVSSAACSASRISAGSAPHTRIAIAVCRSPCRSSQPSAASTRRWASMPSRSGRSWRPATCPPS